MALLKICTLYLVVAVTAAEDMVKCPFNEEECKCSFPSSTDQFLITEVSCDSDAVPTFMATELGKYVVTGRFSVLSGNLSEIQDDQFLAFDIIQTLLLMQKNTAEVTKWDDNAFNGVEIIDLQISGLDKVFPLPNALKKLGKHRLENFSVRNAPSSIQLVDVTFQDNFPYLTALTIEQIRISTISDNALSALRNLEKLTLNEAALPNVSTALAKLITLKSLTLNNNGLTEVYDMITLPLESLSLNDNELSGVLDPALLPPTLKELRLDNAGFNAIPPIIKRSNKLQTVSLSRNSIGQISITDFESGSLVSNLDLSHNVISRIANGATSRLELLSMLNLQDNRLTSVDLSATFPASNTKGTNARTTTILLDENMALRLLTVTEPEKVIANSKFSLKNSGLETIDSKVKDLLKEGSRRQIDIEDSMHLQCQSLDWLVDVECPGKMIIDNAKCADKKSQPLNEYLRSVNPEAKCQSFGDPPPTLGPMSTVTPATVPSTTETGMATTTQGSLFGIFFTFFIIMMRN